MRSVIILIFSAILFDSTAYAALPDLPGEIPSDEQLARLDFLVAKHRDNQEKLPDLQYYGTQAYTNPKDEVTEFEFAVHRSAESASIRTYGQRQEGGETVRMGGGFIYKDKRLLYQKGPSFLVEYMVDDENGIFNYRGIGSMKRYYFRDPLVVYAMAGQQYVQSRGVYFSKSSPFFAFALSRTKGCDIHYDDKSDAILEVTVTPQMGWGSKVVFDKSKDYAVISITLYHHTEDFRMRNEDVGKPFPLTTETYRAEVSEHLDGLWLPDKVQKEDSSGRKITIEVNRYEYLDPDFAFDETDIDGLLFLTKTDKEGNETGQTKRIDGIWREVTD